MAAGLGFKDFVTGEVLTAADVDGYLMQGIWVFTNATARDAAVTSPQEGNFAFTKDNNSLWYYDGAAWVASGATGDIEGVTAGIGISGGGTSGTVTVTNSMATAIDAKGDLVAGTGADTFAKLTVGANNTVLTADSAEATGLKWATPAAGGGMTLIQETVANADTTIAFSSISGSYKQLLLVWTGIYHSTTGTNFDVRINGDTGTNYYTQNAGLDNLGTQNEQKNPTSIQDSIRTLFGSNQNSTDLTKAARGMLLIDNYASTSKNKFYQAQNSFFYNAGGGFIINQFINGQYASNTAITSLDIVRLSGSATFSNTSNTSIRLYGIA